MKNKIFQSRDLCLRSLDTNSTCAKNVRRKEEKYAALRRPVVALRGILYFANTVGIMEFDGVDWRLINTSNNSAVKSLATDTATGRVYVGAKGDFGYLHPNTSGKTEYVSLLDKIPEKSKV